MMGFKQWGWDAGNSLAYSNQSQKAQQSGDVQMDVLQTTVQHALTKSPRRKFVKGNYSFYKTWELCPWWNKNLFQKHLPKAKAQALLLILGKW